MHEEAARLAIARAGQHRRPEQRVEVGDVLADEVIELVRAVGAPELVEVDAFAAAEIQKARHVTDRRIEPDVEELVALARDSEAEVGRIARDVPVFESGRKPLVELACERGVDVLRNPAAELRFESAEFQEQVLRLARRRRRARDGRHRILELERRIRRAAFLARVAVLIGRGADWAGAANVPVRQEHLTRFVVSLLDRLAANEAARSEPPIQLGRELLVLRRVRRQIVVDADAVGREIPLMLGLDAFDQSLRCDTFSLRAQHGRRAVSIAGADVKAAMAAQPLETDPDVGLDVTEHVAQVQRIVRVRQGARNEDGALEGQNWRAPQRGWQRPLLPRPLCRGQGRPR
jgi:hypothetical protein